MDAIFCGMDNLRNTLRPGRSGFGIHLAAYGRETNHPFPVCDIGYLPKKTHRICDPFDSFNFSFILRGVGTYLHQGGMHPVTPPCVLTQSPGVPVDYGPDEWWEELYLIYSPDKLETLRRRGFVPAKPFWRLPATDGLEESLSALFRLLGALDRPFTADRIDVVCETLILESLSASLETELSREERIVRDVQRMVREDFASEHDFDGIARDNGLHPATFRRYWARCAADPPARYQMRLRINEACRLLVETGRTVGEIAYSVGFNDPLYFSRRFRAELGCTATEYRSRHQGALRQAAGRE